VPLLIYCNSFFNPFVWDDEQFIYNNSYVQNFNVGKIFTTNTIAGANEVSNYYRPLTTLSFAWDYVFWGIHVFGYHLNSTLIHIAAGIVLYYLLQQLYFSKKLSFWISLLFLLNPIQTEAVTYVNSRGDSLYTFFGLTSLLCLVLFYKQIQLKFSIYNLKITIPHWVLAVATPILYVLSILSKEIGIAVLGLHGLVSIYLYCYSHKKNIFSFIRSNYSLVSVVSINAVLAGVYLYLRATSLNFNNSFDFYKDNSIYSESLIVRLLTFTKIIFIYLRLLIIPFPLHMERTTTILPSLINPWTIAFFVLVGILIFLGRKEYQKKKTLFIFFGTAWFSIMLLPVSGIIAINGLLYEHWLYLPLVGFFITVYGVLKLFSSKKILAYLPKILIAVAIIYSMLTIRQNYLWGDRVRFYKYLLQHTSSARIHNNLAMALAESEQYDEAIKEYKLALEYGIPYPNIYHNIGNTYAQQKKYSEAEIAYLKAIELDSNFFYSYNNLINLYSIQKKFDRALEISEIAEKKFSSVNCAIIQLDLLKQTQNKTQFEQRKNAFITKYGSNQNAVSVLTKLTY
jgi:tetratricopeptide (TPR) repeat protein